MGLFAARVTDPHVCPATSNGVPHGGGVILPPGCPEVLIAGLPAARRLDKTVCAGPLDPIVLGSFSVLIGNQPAARMTDPTSHGGRILLGCDTVLIGDIAYGSPSQGYLTQEEAAIAALHDANSMSIRDNREYGGLIYGDASGKYYYTAPAPGTESTFDPSSVSAPPGTAVVGDYHTHADYSIANANGVAERSTDPTNDHYNSDQFSVTDLRGIRADAVRSGDSRYRGYLGTPSGTFFEYNPAVPSAASVRPIWP